MKTNRVKMATTVESALRALQLAASAAQVSTRDMTIPCPTRQQIVEDVAQAVKERTTQSRSQRSDKNTTLEEHVLSLLTFYAGKGDPDAPEPRLALAAIDREIERAIAPIFSKSNYGEKVRRLVRVMRASAAIAFKDLPKGHPPAPSDACLKADEARELPAKGLVQMLSYAQPRGIMHSMQLVATRKQPAEPVPSYPTVQAWVLANQDQNQTPPNGQSAPWCPLIGNESLVEDPYEVPLLAGFVVHQSQIFAIRMLHELITFRLHILRRAPDGNKKSAAEELAGRLRLLTQCAKKRL